LSGGRDSLGREQFETRLIMLVKSVSTLEFMSGFRAVPERMRRVTTVQKPTFDLYCDIVLSVALYIRKVIIQRKSLIHSRNTAVAFTMDLLSNIERM
jgi:hypothetical protein